VQARHLQQAQQQQLLLQRLPQQQLALSSKQLNSTAASSCSSMASPGLRGHSRPAVLLQQGQQHRLQKVLQVDHAAAAAVCLQEPHHHMQHMQQELLALPLSMQEARQSSCWRSSSTAAYMWRC
jgi:hypothetical protein